MKTITLRKKGSSITIFIHNIKSIEFDTDCTSIIKFKGKGVTLNVEYSLEEILKKRLKKFFFLFIFFNL